MAGRPSVIPGIKARLEEWLDQREAAYLSQPEETRQPTLPMTPDGKVNVAAVAKAIQMTDGQVKYLFERKELTDLINCICEGQSVLGIGSRVNQTESDKAIRQKIIQQAKSTQEATQAATEAVAAQQELLDRIRALSSELEASKAETERLRARLQAVENGIWVSVQ